MKNERLNDVSQITQKVTGGSRDRSWGRNLIRKQMALCCFQEFSVNKLILKEVCKKKKKSNNTSSIYFFVIECTHQVLNNIRVKTYKPQDLILLDTNSRAYRAHYKHQPSTELTDHPPHVGSLNTTLIPQQVANLLLPSGSRVKHILSKHFAGCLPSEEMCFRGHQYFQMGVH